MNWKKKTSVYVVECYNRTVSYVCLNQSKRAAISMNKAMEFCETLCVVFAFTLKVNKQKTKRRSAKIWLRSSLVQTLNAIYKSKSMKHIS